MNKLIRLLTLVFAFTALMAVNVNAGIHVTETDSVDDVLVGAFDLRDRESFIQITNTTSTTDTVHIQFFDVSNLCNENNFFDVYTGNDTHIYNVRDILTNNGAPAGFVLPSDAYGIFVARFGDQVGIGNIRILDVNGFEYRTNLGGIGFGFADAEEDVYTFNYNTKSGVILSDIIGIALDFGEGEMLAADILDANITFDVDIFNLNEVPFSCRRVIFACTDQNNPLLTELLVQEEASVASFEYGINEAIPSSKDAPLLCPGNNIAEGFVRLDEFDYEADDNIVLFVGLNNGNGRGSMSMLWQDSCTPDDECND